MKQVPFTHQYVSRVGKYRVVRRVGAKGQNDEFKSVDGTGLYSQGDAREIAHELNEQAGIVYPLRPRICKM